MANNSNDSNNDASVYETYYTELQKDLADVDLGIDQVPCYLPLTEDDAETNPFY